MKQCDLIVIGGGAAGLLAAGTAARHGAQVMLKIPAWPAR